ncbi:hypothetical protein OAO16_01505 [Opitutales bacterium]|nr:hypothetical protein [Opitutales bacterium]
MSDKKTTTPIRVPLKALQQYDSLKGEYSSIKKLIWVYFILLLLEGALRKWFLPGLSQGLLIVRDPIVLWIYYLCYSQGIFPSSNKYIIKLTQWTLVATALSIVVNQAHPATIAYGARTNLLHFPLIFIMGRILNNKDVINFGKAFLVLALPMTWVVAQQFQADHTDIVNIAAGGTGHQMMTSGDKVRASGTFSFISGIVFYYCFAVAFIIYGFLNKNAFPKWILYLGTGATLLAMVTAGSRSVIAESLQVIACFGFLAYYRPKEFGRIGASIFGISVIILFLYSQIDLFKEGLGFLSLRFEEASNVEGNPIEAYFIRYWDIIVAPYYYNMWTGFFGNGLGTATRAGAALGGTYGGAELSWSRPVLENGLLVGILFLAWRVWITKDLLLICLDGVRRGNYLAIFIFGAAGPVLLFGILGQPTNLGFAAFGGGLCLATAKSQNKPK